jgi:hypothetical protein
MEARDNHRTSGRLERTTISHEHIDSALEHVRPFYIYEIACRQANSGRDSLAEITQLLQQIAPELKKNVARTNSIQRSHPSVKVPDSIFSREERQSIRSAADSVMASSELEFDFDDIIVNSMVYRRILAEAKSQTRSPAPTDHSNEDILDQSDSSTIKQSKSERATSKGSSSNNDLSAQSTNGIEDVKMSSLWPWRRRRVKAESIFNQPSRPAATQLGRVGRMSALDGSNDLERAGLAIMPGGRVARMADLEGSSSPARSFERLKEPDNVFNPPPTKRDIVPTASPAEAGDKLSNPTESLGRFKDYYSQDEIYDGDLVSVVWAYEARAADEFNLERGDMVRILSMWNDGWAVGVRVRSKAEHWPINSGEENKGDGSASSLGDCKAFPLVCVCLPQHWKKTIEGEDSAE